MSVIPVVYVWIVLLKAVHIVLYAMNVQREKCVMKAAIIAETAVKQTVGNVANAVHAWRHWDLKNAVTVVFVKNAVVFMQNLRTVPAVNSVLNSPTLPAISVKNAEYALMLKNSVSSVAFVMIAVRILHVNSAVCV